MKRLSLRPYHGDIWLCATSDELRQKYRRLTKRPCEHATPEGGGQMILLHFDDADDVYLVWASSTHSLAHEFSHVLLRMFKKVGHDPREGDGEPFCYMLSQLLREAAQ